MPVFYFAMPYMHLDSDNLTSNDFHEKMQPLPQLYQNKKDINLLGTGLILVVS